MLRGAGADAIANAMCVLGVCGTTRIIVPCLVDLLLLADFLLLVSLIVGDFNPFSVFESGSPALRGDRAGRTGGVMVFGARTVTLGRL
jgi:hypothetical protein